LELPPQPLTTSSFIILVSIDTEVIGITTSFVSDFISYNHKDISTLPEEDSFYPRIKKYLKKSTSNIYLLNLPTLLLKLEKTQIIAITKEKNKHLQTMSNNTKP
jgi:hypothetical protein